MSREKLAEIIGVDGSTVWRWETGARAISLNAIPRLSELTGIAPADLRPDLAEIMGTKAAEVTK